MKRMRTRWFVIATVVVAVVIAVVVVVARRGRSGSTGSRPVRAVVGTLRMMVQESGTVQPLNKVQILPPVGGRIDRILVREGAYVKRGQTLAWMSSSDRAVLLDNARAKGEAEVKYWEAAYQPTPIIAPADGLIIARNVVEGQTVSAGTGLYDLSDQLIVEASVDETDLGKIRMEQKAEITVDAYPDKPFAAEVMLIGHQAVKVNNVVSYIVQLDPVRTPGVLRAGMTANVNFILEEHRNVLLLPSSAVKGAENTTVTLKVVGGGQGGRSARRGGEVGAGERAGDRAAGSGGRGGRGRRTGGRGGGEAAKAGNTVTPSGAGAGWTGGGAAEARQVTLGASDGVQVVVLSGMKEGEAVLVDALNIGSAPGGSVLGMPSRPGRQGGGGGRAGGGH